MIGSGRPGALERFVATGIAEGGTTWFALRVLGCGGSPSSVSNLVTVTTPRVAPAAVADLRVESSGEGAVELIWTASGDDGLQGRPARYLIRAATFDLDDQSFATAPAALDIEATRDAGGTERARLERLPCAARHWIALRAEDAVGNLSALSNLLAVEDAPPVPVSDLNPAAVTSRSVELRWTAPPDPGPAGSPGRYELRHAATPIDEASFAFAETAETPAAPGPPGAAERVVVAGLEEGALRYFAIRTVDCAGNPSPLSNPASAQTARVRPDAVWDLHVAATRDSGVLLRWTATGDDGRRGRPRRYVIRVAETPLSEVAFDAVPLAAEHAATASAGEPESLAVGGLIHGHRYWIAMRAEDGVGNPSEISNLVTVFTSPLASREGAALTSIGERGRPPIEIYWQSGGAERGAVRHLSLYDVAGRLVRRYPLQGDDGLVTWDGCDVEGHRQSAGLYFARLVAGSRQARARIVLLP